MTLHQSIEEGSLERFDVCLQRVDVLLRRVWTETQSFQTLIQLGQDLGGMIA